MRYRHNIFVAAVPLWFAIKLLLLKGPGPIDSILVAYLLEHKLKIPLICYRVPPVQCPS